VSTGGEGRVAMANGERASVAKVQKRQRAHAYGISKLSAVS
jgi:hypothetical protein